MFVSGEAILKVSTYFLFFILPFNIYSYELQIQDPNISPEVKAELIKAKEVHLEDAIATRRSINKLVKSVKVCFVQISSDTFFQKFSLSLMDLS